MILSGADPASNKRNADDDGQQLAAEESLSKKAKSAEDGGEGGAAPGGASQQPTRVLHVRNLPPDVTEPELAAICSPFGQVQNILLLKGKSQAFVQMDTPTASSALMQYYASVQAVIRGRSVYFGYSNRDSITVQPHIETPKAILLVTISNLIYPVTIEVLYGVFSKYGAVAKIVIFSKSAAFQALIQFVDVNSAVNAKNALDGQNLYVGACTLRVQYSQLQTLNVKYNNDKSRDFLDPNLPQGPPGGSQQPQFAGGFGAGGQPGFAGGFPGQAGFQGGYQDPSQAMYGGMMAGQAGANVPGMATVLIVSNLNTEKTTTDNLFTLFGVYGDVQRVKILYNKKDTALIQMATHEQAQTAIAHLNNCPFFGKALSVNISKHQYVALPRAGGAEQESAHLTKDYSNSPFHRFRSPTSKNALHICPPGLVLHVAGLPPGSTDESVRLLFGAFRPQKIKFMPKALIQFESVPESVDALVGMHLQQVDGSTLKVSFSKATM